MANLQELVDGVRTFNRFYTQHLGALDEGFMQSNLSLTEARTLWEIGHSGSTTASRIQQTLGYNAGYMSRVLRSLQRSRLVARTRSSTDGREWHLTLTESGSDLFRNLEQTTNQRIMAELTPLPTTDQHALAGSMRTIQTLLNGGHSTGLQIRTHEPGDLGWVMQQHGSIYTGERGWTSDFEALCGQICVDFLQHFDPQRERCWIAELNGERVGCIMLVKHGDAEVGKLRLLLVHPAARGLGLGKQLVQVCLDFAREVGYRKVVLWTNAELHAARSIYAQAGFVCTEVEDSGPMFGTEFVSETWEIVLAPNPSK